MPGPCQCPHLPLPLLRLSQGLCPLGPGVCSQHFLLAFALLHLASVFSLGRGTGRTIPGVGGESEVLDSGPTAQWLPDLD